VCQSDQESHSRLLPLRQVPDSGRGVECERLTELRRVRIIPGGVERARVANEVIDAHPAGNVVFFREIPDPRKDTDRIGDGIEAEDAHRAAFCPQQAEDVFDERRLARPIGAHETVDGAARQRQAHGVQRRLVTEAARQL
jgi:hypothetical protein